MNTSSSGSPEPVPPETQLSTPESPVEPASSRRGLVMLVAAVLVVALALFVGTRVIGVLYGIVFPPQPPRPAPVTELSHDSTAYGVDDWEYGTSLDACQVVRFYQSNNGNCTFAPTVCDAGFIDPATVQSSDNVGQCTGVLQFSIFAMSWEAVIATGYQDDNPTHFKLSREVYWTGEVPPSFASVIEGIPTATPDPKETPPPGS